VFRTQVLVPDGFLGGFVTGSFGIWDQPVMCFFELSFLGGFGIWDLGSIPAIFVQEKVLTNTPLYVTLKWSIRCNTTAWC